jgi:hypothetical protein
LIAAALALVAACERPQQPNTPPADTSSGASSGATTRTTPADISPPASQADKREGRNPQQGQVDPKQSEQRRDFQQRGDDRGPTSPSTQPAPGS